MSEPRAKSRWRRIAKYLLFTAGGLLLGLGGLGWYVTTRSFQAGVRHRIVTQLERITGGRAELGGFHVVPFRFRVEVRDLTIHGLESPKEEPYVHVDRLIANVHIISVLGADLGFLQLTATDEMDNEIKQTILDTYTLRLEDEVRSLRRRRRFWEGMFWCQVPLTVGALIVIVLLVERGR